MSQTWYKPPPKATFDHDYIWQNDYLETAKCSFQDETFTQEGKASSGECSIISCCLNINLDHLCDNNTSWLFFRYLWGKMKYNISERENISLSIIISGWKFQPCEMSKMFIVMGQCEKMIYLFYLNWVFAIENYLNIQCNPWIYCCCQYMSIWQLSGLCQYNKYVLCIDQF